MNQRQKADAIRRLTLSVHEDGLMKRGDSLVSFERSVTPEWESEKPVHLDWQSTDAVSVDDVDGENQGGEMEKKEFEISLADQADETSSPFQPVFEDSTRGKLVTPDVSDEEVDSGELMEFPEEFVGYWTMQSGSMVKLKEYTKANKLSWAKTKAFGFMQRKMEYRIKAIKGGFGMNGIRPKHDEAKLMLDGRWHEVVAPFGKKLMQKARVHEEDGKVKLEVLVKDPDALDKDEDPKDPKFWRRETRWTEGHRLVHESAWRGAAFRRCFTKKQPQESKV